MSASVRPFIVRPSWRTLRVDGPDAASWLNGIVTCDVLSARPGQGVWGSLLNKQGKICADLQIVGQADHLYLGLCGGDPQQVLETLDGYLVMEDAEIQASELAWLLCSEPLSDAGMSPQGSEVSGRVVWGGVALHFVVALAGRLDELSSATSASRFTADEWNAWQTDAGIPQYGVDYSEGDNPHAASIERRTVDWSKGCYLGQEVVCMQDMRGKVRRRLAALSPVSGTLPKSGDLVFDDAGKEVGKVTSVGSLRAIARLTSPAFEEGTKLKAGEAHCLVAQLA